MEQDPAFAFRIIVDIASKGLSPAINDPTTAVLAIDQIHHLLRSVGGRHLDEGLAHDRSGSLRLVYRTPDWEDFVYLAVTEIRQFGGTSIQVARRLRAMLENLTDILSPSVPSSSRVVAAAGSRVAACQRLAPLGSSHPCAISTATLSGAASGSQCITGPGRSDKPLHGARLPGKNVAGAGKGLTCHGVLLGQHPKLGGDPGMYSRLLN